MLNGPTADTLDKKLKKAVEVYEAVHTWKKSSSKRPERAYAGLRSRSAVLALQPLEYRSHDLVGFLAPPLGAQSGYASSSATTSTYRRAVSIAVRASSSDTRASGPVS